MSDFDKEAEREKLREKYERDEEERQATQRMSDLLLKGATMTNTHCGTCGDPLFQQDGTTFCPSCHGNPDAVQGTDLEAQPAEESGGDAADESAANRDPSNDSRDEPATIEPEPEAANAANADDRRTPATDPSAADDSPAASDAAPSRRDRGPADAEPRTADRSRSDASARDTATRSTPDSERSRHAADRDATPSPSGRGDLETARDSLVVALEKFAGKAAETDDPRYAKECLEAAREAGETLSTLR